jgi:hypothetical protein
MKNARKLLLLGATATRGIAVAGAVFAMTGGAHALVIDPAYEFSSNGTVSDSRTFTLGFKFSLSSSETVNALGYTTIGFTSPQQVGLWDSSGNLLASTTIAPGDNPVGHFDWDSVVPLTLAAGTYTIGGTFDGGVGPVNPSGVTTIPGYTWISDEQSLGTGLNYPTNSFNLYGPNGIPQANFSVSVPGPIPGAGLPALLGILAYGVLRRRSSMFSSTATDAT